MAWVGSEKIISKWRAAKQCRSHFNATYKRVGCIAWRLDFSGAGLCLEPTSSYSNPKQVDLYLRQDLSEWCHPSTSASHRGTFRNRSGIQKPGALNLTTVLQTLDRLPIRFLTSPNSRGGTGSTDPLRRSKTDIACNGITCPRSLPRIANRSW